MDYEIRPITCALCGRTALLGILSIGVPHQLIQEFICPDCVTEEHLRRVGTQQLDAQDAEQPEQPEPPPAPPHGARR